jgi:uncharacterized protein YdhG (YjbR/CyaY superfamily)
MALSRQTGEGSGRAVSAKITDMSKNEVDAYLAALEEPKRSTLDPFRRTILEVIPSAEQGMSYGVPAFSLEGKVVAGFAAFKNHLSYLPHSGSVFPELEADLADYKTSKGALPLRVHFVPANGASERGDCRDAGQTFNAKYSGS